MHIPASRCPYILWNRRSCIRVVRRTGDFDGTPAANPYSPVLRLLVIPFLVYLAWLLETFLLAGNPHLFRNPDPAGFALYATAACILTGILFPLILIRKAFVTGAVNMFQIGFRPLRRTLLACSVTFGIILIATGAFSPFGADRAAFAGAFLLLLPGSAAAVMVCWVLLGTHIQAAVRAGGVLLSISTGVIITGILFAASALAADPSLRDSGPFFWPLFTGLVAALFFFAVRDIYATILVVDAAGVFASPGTFSVQSLHGIAPVVGAISLAVIAVLVSVHIWLSWHYATICVPAGLMNDRRGK